MKVTNTGRIFIYWSNPMLMTIKDTSRNFSLRQLLEKIPNSMVNLKLV